MSVIFVATLVSRPDFCSFHENLKKSQKNVFLKKLFKLKNFQARWKKFQVLILEKNTAGFFAKVGFVEK